jgi:hypothetical protein
MTEYSQISDNRIQSRINKRYSAEISTLKGLGFHPLAYCLEDHGPYSALSQFPIIPLSLRYKELLIIKWPFRLASANILLSTDDPPSIALCMGMGIKFYSVFSDGTLVISSTFLSSMVPRQGSKIVRLPPQTSLQETWSVHKTEVRRRSNELEFLTDVMTFGDYVLMSGFEEDLSQYTSG